MAGIKQEVRGVSLHEDLDGNLRNTQAGQAHTAGSGDAGKAGKRCRQCIHMNFPKKLYKADGTLMDGRCGMYRQILGYAGPAFAGRTVACRYFEENPDAPNVVKPKKAKAD